MEGRPAHAASAGTTAAASLLPSTPTFPSGAPSLRAALKLRRQARDDSCRRRQLTQRGLVAIYGMAQTELPERLHHCTAQPQSGGAANPRVTDAPTFDTTSCGDGSGTSILPQLLKDDGAEDGAAAATVSERAERTTSHAEPHTGESPLHQHRLLFGLLLLWRHEIDARCAGKRCPWVEGGPIDGVGLAKARCGCCCAINQLAPEFPELDTVLPRPGPDPSASPAASTTSSPTAAQAGESETSHGHIDTDPSGAREKPDARPGCLAEPGHITALRKALQDTLDHLGPWVQPRPPLPSNGALHSGLSNAVAGCVQRSDPQGFVAWSWAARSDMGLVLHWEQTIRVIESNPLGTPPLSWALSHLAIHPRQGLWLEFGVAGGKTLTAISAAAKALGSDGPGTVYGFDSFEGLPEQWRVGFNAGKFSRGGVSPEISGDNVELVVGWFDDTVPRFLETHEGPIALAHIDCDLYSSALTVLCHIRPRLRPGAILVFDELMNYGGAQSGEFRAVWEALECRGVRLRWVGCGRKDAMAAVAVVEAVGNLPTFSADVA